MTNASKAPADLSAFSPRERVLAAALKLFVEQGYFNTNVPDLSRESKCSVGSIYHNFKNKEEVASALYEEGIKAFRRALEQRLNENASVEVFIKTLIHSFLQFSEVNQQLSRYLWLCRHNEFMSGMIKHPTMVGFDRFGRQLTKKLRKGVKEGLVRDVKAHVLWSMLFGIPLAYVRDWLEGINTEPPSAVADQIVEACWRALKA